MLARTIFAMMTVLNSKKTLFACFAKRLIIGLGACLLVSLSACGFALKGASQPLPFKSVQLQAQANSYLSPEIQKKLSAQGIRLSLDPTEALPRIGLNKELRERTVLTTNTNGRVREYQLRHTVTVQVWDGQGKEWLSPTTFTQSRDLSFNENQLLAKEAEEIALYKNMQDELIAAIMRRLDATRSTAAPQ